MKKIVALLLALTFVCIAFASCGGGNSLEGKSFKYEKLEVDFEDDEAEEFINSLLSDGQSAADYFAENMFGEMKGLSIYFEDGKMYGKMGDEQAEEGVEYTLKGEDITFAEADEEPMEGATFKYVDGKLVLTVETEVGLISKSKVALKLFFKEA